MNNEIYYCYLSKLRLICLPYDSQYRVLNNKLFLLLCFFKNSLADFVFFHQRTEALLII